MGDRNMPDIKISIIVPVYNSEKYLPETAQSILKQSFSDFELILVDDGSKDGSGKICDQLAAKDTRIKVIHKTKRRDLFCTKCRIKRSGRRIHCIL